MQELHGYQKSRPSDIVMGDSEQQRWAFVAWPHKWDTVSQILEKYYINGQWSNGSFLHTMWMCVCSFHREKMAEGGLWERGKLLEVFWAIFYWETFRCAHTRNQNTAAIHPLRDFNVIAFWNYLG